MNFENSIGLQQAASRPSCPGKVGIIRKLGKKSREVFYILYLHLYTIPSSKGEHAE